MQILPNILPPLASSFERYLTLERVHPTKIYSYATRGYFDLPVFDVTQHAPKCKIGESWLYIAIPTGASVASLDTKDKLYVGAQTQDRMFRGDGLKGNNYHHAEMRAGNGTDNPVSFLRSGKSVEILRISASSIKAKVMSSPDLATLIPLLQQPRHSKRHLGWWYEQYILFNEPKVWRWNTDSADKLVRQVLSN